MSDKRAGGDGNCACNPDPFGDLPPELRPRSKKQSSLRRVRCPSCGLNYLTNRGTDLCIECERAATQSVPINRTQRGRRMKMLSIKVLGPGCANCEKVEQVARQAVDSLSVEAKIEKVTEYNEIHKYPILATPGLVVNEELVCAGRIPEQAEVVTWLANAMQAS